MKKAYLFDGKFFMIIKKTKDFKSLAENVKDPCKPCDLRFEKGCRKTDRIRKIIEKKNFSCGYDFFIKIIKKKERF